MGGLGDFLSINLQMPSFSEYFLRLISLNAVILIKKDAININIFVFLMIYAAC